MFEWITCPHGLGLPHLIRDTLLFLVGAGSMLVLVHNKIVSYTKAIFSDIKYRVSGK